MVERIVDGGRSLLLREGYAAFTTNRVAAEAGVSPGSLYQYFPDKEAVLEAVVERYWADLSERLAAALSQRIGDLGPQMVRGVAEAVLAALEADAPLLRVMQEDLPQGRNRERALGFERRLQDLLTAYLASRSGLTRTDDHATTAWFLLMCIEQLTVRYVLDRPAIPRARFLDELVELCLRYAGNDEGPARGAGPVGGR